MDQPARQTNETLRPLVASCFGLGYSPIMPGTCGALLGLAFYLPIAWLVPQEPVQTVCLGLVLVAWCWITVALGGWAEHYYGQKDSQKFVTDEVAGLLLTLLLWHVPSRPVLTALWAFPMTRLLDIAKVPPARRLEQLPRGWGVLADDLLSSVYAAGLLWIVRLTFPSWFGGSDLGG
jgi:phosphatidylglycerophosphatase A